jgi:nicotinate-nucleotide adenylyltransferase
MSVDFKSHTAILGGSFNPPHVGHVQAARDLLKDHGVKEVLVVPSYGTPLKAVTIDFHSRFQMAELAFRNFESVNQVRVSDVEQKAKHQFTWQLLEGLSHTHAKLAFVVGTDQLIHFEKWDRFPEVLGMCDWMILKRKPSRDLSGSLVEKEISAALNNFVSQGWLRSTSNPNEFEIRMNGKQKTLLLVETTAPNVSSTEIRAAFAQGRNADVKSLLPKEVYEFIERNKLYGT